MAATKSSTRKRGAATELSLRQHMVALLEARLKEHGLLVFYDDTRQHLFRDLVQEVGGVFVEHIDVSLNPIEAHKQAGEALHDLTRQVILYVPYAKPKSSTQWVCDAWSAYAVLGGQFPEKEMDKYLQMATALYPDKADDIRALFKERNGEPSFDDVDRVGNARGKWALLEAESGCESRKEVLAWLLSTTTLSDEKTFARLQREAQAFVKDVFGLKEAFKSGKALQTAAWERALVTAFVSSLGNALPMAFATLEVAPKENADLISAVLENLSASLQWGPRYCQEADDVEKRLGLVAVNAQALAGCQLDVFRFEERNRLLEVVKCLEARDVAGAEKLLPTSTNVWAAEDVPSLEWAVVRRAIDCVTGSVQAVNALEASSGKLEGFVQTYAERGYLFDSLMRSFELAMEELEAERGASAEMAPTDDALDQLRVSLRAMHRTQCARVQKHFTDLLLAEGWPTAGILNNAETFDTFVAPRLVRTGDAVVLLIVDGLRFELGRALTDALSGYSPELIAASAVLPSITSVGKASLLPGGRDLELKVDATAETLTPVLRGKALPGLQERMSFLKAVYGDRFQEMTTADFLSGKRRLSESTALLVLRNDDIDGFLENNRPGLLRSVRTTMNELVRTVERIKKRSRFSEIIIATDHGFVLNYAPAESDRCTHPDGHWIDLHDRMVLGDGIQEEPSNLKLLTTAFGMRTNAREAAMPLGLCAYAASKYYFHGGASLEEAVLPVIRVKLAREAQAAPVTVGGKLVLAPKRPCFTTLSVRVFIHDPNGANDPTPRQAKILVIRAGDRTWTPVGRLLDNDAGFVTLDGVEKVELRIRLDEFDAPSMKFSVLALDPASNMTLGNTSFEVELTQ